MNRLDVLSTVVTLALMTFGCNGTAHHDSSEVGAMAEHAVLVHLKLSDDDFGSVDERDQIHELSDQLEAAIENSAVGEFDGDEFGEGQCTLFIYGPDADALFRAIEPILSDSPLSSRGYAIKRYGSASDIKAKEIRVDF